MCSSLCFMVFMCIWWLHPCQKRLTRKDLAKVPQTQTVPTVSTFSEWAKRNLLQAVSNGPKLQTNTLHYFTRIVRSQLPLRTFTKHTCKAHWDPWLNMTTCCACQHHESYEYLWRDMKRRKNIKYIDTKKTRSIQPRFKARFLQAALVSHCFMQQGECPMLLKHLASQPGSESD